MRPVLLAFLLCLISSFCAADDGVPGTSKCPPLDPHRFWLPDDRSHAMEIFLEKARRINDSGTCVVDGWYGKNEHKYYMTVIPPGYNRIGKVVSFSFEELRSSR